jgi:putative ABC transport system permease protein
MGNNPPFFWEDGNSTPFTIVGQPLPEAGREPILDMQIQMPGYFRALQTRLLEGRDFDLTDKRAKDERTKDPVVIVNQALAEAFFPGQSPINKQIELPGSYMAEKTYTIIGVVQNMRHGGPDHHAAKFAAYFPYCQHLDHNGTVILRSSGDPRALLRGLRQTIASIDPEIPLGQVTSYDDLIASRFSIRRLSVLLTSIFSGASLFLSAVGLYGVLAYTVSRQTREIGVRIALGALPRNILLLIFKRGFAIVGVGIVVGSLTAVAFSGALGIFLYGVAGNDPLTIGLSVLVLCLAGLAACLLPALRAIRINPVIAMRE